ncbi:MAG TPA: AAA family ATPase [Thermoanaerobaculia bacterium]|jgi:predicted AAA+ superfamily ATPase
MARIGRFFQEPRSSYFLFGPRGTGKSTWLRAHHPEALWVDLLQPDVHRQYAARPERLRDLVRAHREHDVVVVDEVQKVPELLVVVHGLIEERRGLRFVLTGSSARKLKRSGVDLLAGRALLRYLHPFMAAELAPSFNADQALKLGLLPLVWDAEEPAEALNAYVALYLREEVQQEGLVRDLGSFSRFLEVTTFSHGAVLNVADMARECQVSRKTVVGYLEVLEDLLLSFRLPVFTRRARRLLSAHPKFYWFDSGVFVSMRPASVIDRPQEIAGAALEGLVAQHLRAWIDYSGNDCRLAYWRTKSGSEVDFVVWGQAGFWALEVKHTTTLRPKDLRAIRAFREDYPEATVRLLYRGGEKLEIDGILCVPCSDYLLGIVPGEPLP